MTVQGHQTRSRDCLSLEINPMTVQGHQTRSRDCLSLEITVEVSNTGHIILFKVILKLFAGTFLPFFLEKKLYQYFYFSYLIQFKRIGHEKYFILFFKSAGRCYTWFV
jgi:hypothetical protein